MSLSTLSHANGETPRTRHTLSVLVEDKPGVLARVAALFSRRGFNIESLAVGPTEHAKVSRMTIVVSVEGLLQARCLLCPDHNTDQLPAWHQCRLWLS